MMLDCIVTQQPQSDLALLINIVGYRPKTPTQMCVIHLDWNHYVLLHWVEHLAIVDAARHCGCSSRKQTSSMT